MNAALNEAKNAFNENEIPVGAVIVIDNKIIAKAHNQTEKLHDSTAHAEILAITAACNFLNSKYLTKATVFVTVEPCIMCIGAMFWSKINKLIYGANEPKTGFSKYQNILKNRNLSLTNPKMIIKKGILEQESSELIKKFFRKKRL